MRQPAYVLPVLLVALAAPAAHAACYADYKARAEDNGQLRLHYGVIQVAGGDCPPSSEVRRTVSARLENGGWTLLDLVGTFGEDGLDERRSRAGEYFLRF